MINEYLYLLRKYSGKTQSETAEAADLKLSRYKNFESGAREMKQDDCILLSKILGFNEDILSDENEQSVIQKLYNLLETPKTPSVSPEPGPEELSDDEFLLLMAYRYSDEQNKQKFKDLADKIRKNIN